MKYRIHYIGIDPGKSNGSIVVIDNRGKIVSMTKMPVAEYDQWETIKDADRNCDESWAMIEKINPGFHGIHKSAAAKLYGNYLAMRAFLTAAAISFEEVSPVIWQRAMGIEKRRKSESSTEWKNRIKGKAIQLYPSSNIGQQKITLATCDALLIATHLARLNSYD